MPTQKWYQDPHLWTKIVTDLIAVTATLAHYLPPKWGAAMLIVSQTLFAIDQTIGGAVQDAQTKTISATVGDVSTTATTPANPKV